jgi:hypothetical protein
MRRAALAVAERLRALRLTIPKRRNLLIPCNASTVSVDRVSAGNRKRQSRTFTRSGLREAIRHTAMEKVCVWQDRNSRLRVNFRRHRRFDFDFNFFEPSRGNCVEPLRRQRLPEPNRVISKRYAVYYMAISRVPGDYGSARQHCSPLPFLLELSACQRDLPLRCA